MFSIPFIFAIVFVCLIFSVALAAIFLTLRAGDKLWVAIGASILSALMAWWIVDSGLNRSVVSTNYYEITNVNYSDAILGQIYVKDKMPCKILDGVVYDTGVYHVKIETYETTRNGISWPEKEKVEVVKKMIITVRDESK